jgi:UDP-N-acetylglucosamine--N-acetylmuramyl-(pentapeptide) pyrophosphoryl-undecaprenol N-acetylglucosamine transferase
MRVLISGGGTGGHVYPALAVAEALQREQDTVEILYVGGPDGMEKAIVARTNLPYRDVDAGQIRGMTPQALLRNVRHLRHGYRQSHKLLAEWPADAALVTGGYVTVPVSLAAWRRGIPVMVYLPDLEPGWAVRFLSHFATRVAVSFDEVRRFFPAHKVWVSGYPVRAALLNVDREVGYKILGLAPSLRTLLVFGGSRGARSINRALIRILPELLEHFQVIHVSGQLDWQWVSEQRDTLPTEIQHRYYASPYMHEELIAAMAVADLAVARAGAATLAEFPAIGLPSILVPYPYAGQHQKQNADFMVAHGAAVCIKDIDLDAQLKPTVMRLLQDEPALRKMGSNALALSKPNAARQLSAELQRLAHSKRGKAR